MVRQRVIISRLKRIIKVKGAAQIAVDLGLADSNSVNRWVRNQVIPNTRRDQLVKYIKENGGSFDSHRN